MPTAITRQNFRTEAPWSIEIGQVVAADMRASSMLSVSLSGGRVIERVLSNGDSYNIGDDVVVLRHESRNMWIVIAKITNASSAGLANGSNAMYPPSNLVVAGRPREIFVSWDTRPDLDVAWQVQSNSTDSETGATDVLVSRGSYYIYHAPTDEAERYFRVRALRWISASNIVASSWSAWMYGKAMTWDDRYALLHHHERHEEGSDDEIKLDDLATADDNTDLDSTKDRHGLLPKLSGNEYEFLDGKGEWSLVHTGSGGSIQDEGVDLPIRNKLDFVGQGVTAMDAGGGEETGTSHSYEIVDEGDGICVIRAESVGSEQDQVSDNFTWVSQQGSSLCQTMTAGLAGPLVYLDICNAWHGIQGDAPDPTQIKIYDTWAHAGWSPTGTLLATGVSVVELPDQWWRITFDNEPVMAIGSKFIIQLIMQWVQQTTGYAGGCQLFYEDTDFAFRTGVGGSATVTYANDPLYVGEKTTGVPTDFGIRFRGVTVPNGVTVTAAHMQIAAGWSDESDDTVSARITAELNATPAVFSTRADYDGRAQTVNHVDWSPLPATVIGTQYNSPDLTAIIQEIVNLPGWVSGGDIALFVKNHGSTPGTGRVFSDLAGLDLYIEYGISTENRIMVIVPIWEPVTNGDPANPELLFVDGDVLMTGV